MVLVVWH
nr:unnamed protein product [Callosobruchus chinensis]